jgi:phosphoglycolate phosphatase
MGYDVLLFDLDGTLTESGPGIMHSAAWALKQLGVPVGEPELLRRFVGPPLSDTFQNCYGVPPEQVEEAIRLYRVWYNDHGGIYESEPYPGIVELLKELNRRGKRLMVATSKPLPLAEVVLDHWGLTEHFEAVFGGTMDEKGCKKSLVVKHALDCCGDAAAQGRVLMVGDREHDIFGAHENAIPCAGVLWGYGSEEEFAAAGAEYIVKDCAELLKIAGGN